MGQVLYSTSSIRNRIIDVLSDVNDQRIVITAFVGIGAEDYIQKPQGLTLICWPKAGGTNPNVIRKLINAGVKVKFCNSLHMKLYWSKKNGAVLTSANLTKNALGSGNLKEIGIYLASEEIDIVKILNRIKTRNVTKNEMFKLDLEHEQFYAKNIIKDKSEITNYKEWYKSPHRNNWKICYCEGSTDFAKSAKEYSKNIFGKSTPDYCVSHTGNNIFKKGDWVILFKINKNNKPYEFQWMYVDFVVKVSRDDEVYDEENPYQYVQVWSISRYERPPFTNDKKFMIALGKVINNKKLNLRKKIEKMSQPSKTLLDSLYKYYK